MQTRDDALKYVMPFGKYFGQTIGQVYGEDKTYLQWVMNTFYESKWPKLIQALVILGFTEE